MLSSTPCRKRLTVASWTWCFFCLFVLLPYDQCGKMLEKYTRLLKPQGSFIVDVMHPDAITARLICYPEDFARVTDGIQPLDHQNEATTYALAYIDDVQIAMERARALAAETNGWLVLSPECIHLCWRISTLPISLEHSSVYQTLAQSSTRQHL